jgi:hypothetical protein
LWQILVVLAFRKRCNQIQYERRKRRQPAGGRVYVASALELDGSEAGGAVHEPAGSRSGDGVGSPGGRGVPAPTGRVGR